MSLRALIDRTVFALGVTCVIAFSSPTYASDTRTQLLDFFSGEGCVIGSQSREAAIAAGHDADDIIAFVDAMRTDGDAAVQGKWLQLSAQICKIKLPNVTGTLKLTDPDVAVHFSERDEYKAEGEPGCFLNGGAFLKGIEKSRNWSPDKANQEYLRLLAASIISGDMAFYSDDPLRTPMGFAKLTGACAEIPLMPEIKRNQDLLIEHFGGLVRAKAAFTKCENGARVITDELRDAAKTLSDGEITNAWLGLELFIIAAGAGWYEGMTATERGIPRPPLCHYE